MLAFICLLYSFAFLISERLIISPFIPDLCNMSHFFPVFSWVVDKDLLVLLIIF